MLAPTMALFFLLAGGRAAPLLNKYVTVPPMPTATPPVVQSHDYQKMTENDYLSRLMYILRDTLNNISTSFPEEHIKCDIEPPPDTGNGDTFVYTYLKGNLYPIRDTTYSDQNKMFLWKNKYIEINFYDGGKPIHKIRLNDKINYTTDVDIEITNSPPTLSETKDIQTLPFPTVTSPNYINLTTNVTRVIKYFNNTSLFESATETGSITLNPTQAVQTETTLIEDNLEIKGKKEFSELYGTNLEQNSGKPTSTVRGTPIITNTHIYNDYISTEKYYNGSKTTVSRDDFNKIFPTHTTSPDLQSNSPDENNKSTEATTISKVSESTTGVPGASTSYVSVNPIHLTSESDSQVIVTPIGVQQEVRTIVPEASETLTTRGPKDTLTTITEYEIDRLEHKPFLTGGQQSKSLILNGSFVNHTEKNEADFEISGFHSSISETESIPISTITEENVFATNIFVQRTTSNEIKTSDDMIIKEQTTSTENSRRISEDTPNSPNISDITVTTDSSLIDEKTETSLANKVHFTEQIDEEMTLSHGALLINTPTTEFQQLIEENSSNDTKSFIDNHRTINQLQYTSTWSSPPSSSFDPSIPLTSPVHEISTKTEYPTTMHNNDQTSTNTNPMDTEKTAPVTEMYLHASERTQTINKESNFLPTVNGPEEYTFPISTINEKTSFKEIHLSTDMLEGTTVASSNQSLLFDNVTENIKNLTSFDHRGKSFVTENFGGETTTEDTSFQTQGAHVLVSQSLPNVTAPTAQNTKTESIEFMSMDGFEGFSTGTPLVTSDREPEDTEFTMINYSSVITDYLSSLEHSDSSSKSSVTNSEIDNNETLKSVPTMITTGEVSYLNTDTYTSQYVSSSAESLETSSEGRVLTTSKKLVELSRLETVISKDNDTGDSEIVTAYFPFVTETPLDTLKGTTNIQGLSTSLHHKVDNLPITTASIPGDHGTYVVTRDDPMRGDRQLKSSRSYYSYFWTTKAYRVPITTTSKPVFLKSSTITENISPNVYVERSTTLAAVLSTTNEKHTNYEEVDHTLPIEILSKHTTESSGEVTKDLNSAGHTIVTPPSSEKVTHITTSKDDDSTRTINSDSMFHSYEETSFTKIASSTHKPEQLGNANNTYELSTTPSLINHNSGENTAPHDGNTTPTYTTESGWNNFTFSLPTTAHLTKFIPIRVSVKSATQLIK